MSDCAPLGDGVTTPPRDDRSAEKEDVPRCVAHGEPMCANCSRITLGGITEDGECRGCSVWGSDGIHWDTCPERIRGTVYANRTDALAAYAVEQRRQVVRSILLDYARPTSGSGWGAVNETADRILAVFCPPAGGESR